MTTSHIAETAVPYAILALYDADLEITEVNLSKLLESAGIEVEPVWLSVFCRSVDRNSVKTMLSSFEAGAAAVPVAGGASAAAAAPGGKAAPAAEDKKKKEEPEEEEEMSLSLFD